VIAVTKASSTSWEIVVSSAFLFAGAAVALVSSRKEFAPLKKQMDLYGRVVAYLSALLAYMVVLTELGSSLRTLGLITVIALVIFLLAILAAGSILRRRARPDDQAGVQGYPEPQAEGSQQAMGRVGSDEQGAGAPEEGAVDGSVPEPGRRRGQE
jgi:hypothetical protein